MTPTNLQREKKKRKLTAYLRFNGGKGFSYSRMVCSKCKKDCDYHMAMKFGITDPFYKEDL